MGRDKGALNENGKYNGIGACLLVRCWKSQDQILKLKKMGEDLDAMWRYFLHENRVNNEIAETREVFYFRRLGCQRSQSAHALLFSHLTNTDWSTTLGRFSGSIGSTGAVFQGKQNNTTLKKSFSKALISIYFDETKIKPARAKESQEIKNCNAKLHMSSEQMRARETKKELFMSHSATSQLPTSSQRSPWIWTYVDGFALGREMGKSRHLKYIGRLKWMAWILSFFSFFFLRSGRCQHNSIG